MTPDSLDRVVEAVAGLVAKARDSLARGMEARGGIDAAALEREQHALHGLAWLATYGATLKSVAAFARRLAAADRFTEIERLLTGILFGEYVEQIIGGIPMNQQELETYTAARGAEFKRELGSLGANPSEGDVKAAFVRANGRALATVGAGSIPRTRNAARVRVSARSRPAGLLRGGLGRRRRGLRLAGSRLRSSRRRRRLSLA